MRILKRSISMTNFQSFQSRLDIVDEVLQQHELAAQGKTFRWRMAQRGTHLSTYILRFDCLKKIGFLTISATSYIELAVEDQKDGLFDLKLLWRLPKSLPEKFCLEIVNETCSALEQAVRESILVTPHLVRTIN